MDRVPASAGISRLLHPQASDFTAPSLSTSFKLDEGYSDDTKSQADNDLNVPSDDVMSLPDWVLTHSEAERAELAYRLLKSLRTSTVASVVERLDPLLHMDPVVKLPPEITSEIFSYLDPQTLLTASLASRSWRSRIFDSRLWRGLYNEEGWRVDIDAIRNFEQEYSESVSASVRKARTRHADSDLGEPKLKKRMPSSWTGSNGSSTPATGRTGEQNGPVEDHEGDQQMGDALIDQYASSSAPVGKSQDEFTLSKSIAQLPLAIQPPLKSSILVRNPNGTVKINWLHLYKLRRRLEENWVRGRYTNFQLPHPSHPEEAHLECVYAIQFEGKWLVSGSRDRTVRVWNLETKRLWHRPLIGHLKSVLCLQFDSRPSEDVIISGSSDKNVIIWRFSTGEKIHQISNAHDDSVLNLRFDERYLVTCSKDKLIKIWNRRALTPLDEDYPKVSPRPGVRYPSYIIDTTEMPSPVVEAELANGHIRSLEPHSLLMTLEGHGAAVNAIQLNGNEIVSASGDRLIKIWNIQKGGCTKTLMGHEKGIACVQFDNRRIISGSNDDTVRIFDSTTGAQVACLHGHANLVRTVQAGFGDPPGAEEAMRLEALAVDNRFLQAHEANAEGVGLGPSALRRAGYTQDTTGSRDPRDVGAIGAALPPGGGGSRWGRIVSGSYDECILIWSKDRQGKWVTSQKLRQVEAAAAASTSQAQSPRTARTTMTRLAPGQGGPAPNNNAIPQQGSANPPITNGQQGAAPAQGIPNLPLPPGPASNRPLVQPVPAHHHHHVHHPHPLPHPHLNRAQPPQPTSRVFKLQFDARKIICASQDPRIVGWDFVGNDEELEEACQFFQGL
ncbi:hypothetical protein ASPWEDRAFT_47388 [Aspergillus wentii DTO 134E9]|uniref:Probable E3 ubiquitin ligase complex SCF subunit sconB n=1 Tax=Aspergillus wentii DTO 134E9 TaxID=1073089 RepID=A0A1L9S0C5_ASPWE|nr:uncharacterized protein ASPWEDRAFT_47388 [Aspergillus wentii DTO 134E9]KAI9933009.1 hypothetical protein MW887_009263 [Aspergillus wentii]OJJ40593.1 hypothetical protein ASPWEDRAFT_47388 [Aspergillus wentii DTO 134E9]